MDDVPMKIFLVDDDALYLRDLALQFEANHTGQIVTFATGEDCLEKISEQPGLVILDYHLNGIDHLAMNGIATLDKIKSYNPDIYVVMLSGQDKIEVAVECMHHQAFDYVVKSETAFMRLLKIISNIKHVQKIQKELAWYMDRM